MKFLIAFTLAALQVVIYAAQPGFDSFNTNQFDVTGNRVAIKDGVVLTNLTLTGSSVNLLEVYDSSNDLKFWIDPNGFSYPNLWTNNAGTFSPITGADPDFPGVQYISSLNTFILKPDGVDTNSQVVLESSTDASDFHMHAYKSGGLREITAYQYDGGSVYYQVFAIGNGQYPSGQNVLLDPFQENGSTLFIFNSGISLGSGNLFEVKNNGTNKFYVAWDGTTSAGDTTVNNLTINTNVTVNNNITVKGNAILNVVSAMSQTVSNDLTVLGNYVGTIDPTASGTMLKVQKSLKLQFPRYVDNAGCTYANTNDYTALTFMLPQFSGTGATNANYCDFAFRIPADLDTSKDLTASLTIRLTGADTSGHTYDVGMVSIANSGAAAGTPANFVALTITGDASGASGDIESVSNVTLTSWKSNMTAGQWCLLRLNRDGANDASTVASNLMELEIFYWATQ